MSSGKKIRLSRLCHGASGKSMIVPMDHGATMGPIPGLVDLREALLHLCGDAALVQGVVLHRGAMERLGEGMPCHLLPPRILHVSGSTSVGPAPTAKSLVARVEDALHLGADAVSVQVNLGDDAEATMLRDLGSIASACQRWGMPMLAMMYVRIEGRVSSRVEDVKLAARVAAEMGADLVKVSYPGSVDAMAEVAEGSFIPVLIAGGEKSDSTQAAMQMVRAAMSGGASGVCIGRNLFQAPDPGAFARAMGEVVHGIAQGPRQKHPGRDLELV